MYTVQYVYIYIEKKNAPFCILLHSFAKAFFYVLSKRMMRSLHSFIFLRKECKRTHCSFGSHKLPKTRKKNAKKRLGALKECKRTMHSERKRMQCPTLVT